MSNHIGPVQRVVVCAANRFGTTVICGARHFDLIMRDQIDRLQPSYAALAGSDWEQGFIDQWGVFMGREEALYVATKAGQINTRRTKTQPDNKLFSEDLY